MCVCVVYIENYISYRIQNTVCARHLSALIYICNNAGAMRRDPPTTVFIGGAHFGSSTTRLDFSYRKFMRGENTNRIHTEIDRFRAH